jgi:hypothetical protein
MAAVCSLCGDQSGHAIVFLALLTIRGKENHSGARKNADPLQLTTRSCPLAHLRPQALLGPGHYDDWNWLIGSLTVVTLTQSLFSQFLQRERFLSMLQDAISSSNPNRSWCVGVHITL